MDNYFTLNQETGKVELHFARETYQALTEAQKQEIKSNFLWGRNSGCWISRAKWPNTGRAERCAAALGLEDAGKTGERVSFAEQMERKAERAERRADRCEERADAAATRGEHLQKPIEDMRGDIAFFTQPNISSSAGRAFTRRRAAMWASFERGMDEFRKSEYWRERAATARRTANQSGLQDVAFLDRRIRERESDIRKLRRSVEEYETALETAEGERAERIRANIERWLDMLEAKLDELGYYQDCMDALGGVRFSRENVRPGCLVKTRHHGILAVVSTGPKNFYSSGCNYPWPYAEIAEIVKTPERAE